MSRSIMSVGCIEASNDQLFPFAEQLLSEGHTFTLTLHGNSMRPFLEDGRDTGLLVPMNPDELKVGDVVLCEFLPRRYALHRVIAVRDHDFDMLGDGNLTPEYHCPKSRIIARAEGFYRKGRKQMDSVNGRKWRLYSFLWTRLRPLRRYLLFIYRRYYRLKCILQGK